MERQWVQWLRNHATPHRWMTCGIGDDASVHRLPDGHQVVVTTDLICEGVHFRRSDVSPEQIGRKALGVNLSDLAAMAAEPVAAWASLLLPRTDAALLAQRLLQGMLELAEPFGIALAGGDTNTWDGELVISVTAMGVVQGEPLRRNGARPGDRILVTGSLGGSLLGKHFALTPRVAEARVLHQRYQLAAGMDISDGLALDLSRMAEASGCGAVLELDRVPIAEAAYCAAAADGRAALDHALGDGEDFELLLAAAPGQAERMLADQPLGVPLTAIGSFVAQPGLWQVRGAGPPQPLEPVGYEHRQG